MNIEKKISDRIKVISFYAMLCVIGWHCFCGSRLERYVIPLFYWSVPWFFVVSGAFFALTVKQRSIRQIVRAKFRSLAVPYLVWSILGSVVLGNICGAGLADLFCFTSSRMYPVGNQALWYLRALIVFNVIGIVLWYSLRWVGRYSCWLVSVMFICTAMIVNRYLIPISTGSSSFYFAIGMLIPRVANLRVRGLLSFYLLIGALAAKVSWFLCGYDFYSAGGNVLTNLSTMLFIGAIWNGIDSLPNLLGICVAESAVSSVSALCYFMHFPIARKIISYEIEACAYSRSLLFVINLLFLPVLFVLTALALKKYLPKVYCIVSGGR